MDGDFYLVIILIINRPSVWLAGLHYRAATYNVSGKQEIVCMINVTSVSFLLLHGFSSHACKQCVTVSLASHSDIPN